MSIGEDSLLGVVSHEKTGRALFALLELSKALSSEIDLDSLLHVIVENASDVVDADRTSIFVYDPAKDRLANRVAQGLDGKVIELPMGSGIAGEVAQSRTLANIPDVYADRRFNPSFDQQTGYRTRSMICVPVVGSDGNLLGVIQSVNKKSGNHFDGRDETLMRAIASHIAVAFERARLTEVHVENQRLEQALRVANEIQMRMLPAPAATGPDGTFALEAFLRPAKDVGGDLYDYFWENRRLHFCIGDVSGKGVGAALVMAMTKTLFRAYAALRESPAEVLASMSGPLCEETDAAMFVTALCGTLDLTTGVVRVSNAGHDRPLLLPADGTEVRPVEVVSGLPLGIFPSFRYRTTELQLRRGDSLFMLTDGVTEANDRDEQLFGHDRTLAAVARNAARTPSEIVRSMVAAVDEFAGGGPQADDLTMMCIRYLGPPNV